MRFTLCFGDKPVYCKSVILDLVGDIKSRNDLLDIAQMSVMVVMMFMVI